MKNFLKLDSVANILLTLEFDVCLSVHRCICMEKETN